MNHRSVTTAYEIENIKKDKRQQIANYLCDILRFTITMSCSVASHGFNYVTLTSFLVILDLIL